MTFRFFKLDKLQLVTAIVMIFPYSVFALPFGIAPTVGTTLPTEIITGQTIRAYYTITNNTASTRSNNFIKYLPPNVTQITSDNNISDLCGSAFSLQSHSSAGDSCTLELLISGAVSAADPDPHHHLFACFPGGLTCSGTPSQLNVSLVEGPSEFVAGGSYLDMSDNDVMGLATSTDSGATWTQQALTVPVGYVTGSINGVSCSGTMCTSTGFYQDIDGNIFFAVATSTDKGASWSQQVLTPPNGFNNGSGQGIYCASQACLAVGAYNEINSSHELPAIARTSDNGLTWSQQILTLPNGIQTSAITGISCVSSLCVGSALYSNGSAELPGVYVSQNTGQTWTSQLFTLPSGFSDGILNGVACSGAACIAVGVYLDDNTFKEHLAVASSTDNGSSWSQQILTPFDSFTEGAFNGISCTSSYCVAVGQYTFSVAYTGYPAIAVTTNNGTSWAQQTLSIPQGYTKGFLKGVNCSGAICVAGGYYQNNFSNKTPFIAVSMDSGSTWTQQLLTPPTGFTAGEFNSVG